MVTFKVQKGGKKSKRKRSAFDLDYLEHFFSNMHFIFPESETEIKLLLFERFLMPPYVSFETQKGRRDMQK